MTTAIPNSPRRDSRSFQKIVDAFLANDALPFAEILSAQRIERIFLKHDCLFGMHGCLYDGNHGVVFPFTSPP